MPNNDKHEELIGSKDETDTPLEVDELLEAARLLREGVEISPEIADEIGAELVSAEEFEQIED